MASLPQMLLPIDIDLDPDLCSVTIPLLRRKETNSCLDIPRVAIAQCLLWHRKVVLLGVKLAVTDSVRDLRT